MVYAQNEILFFLRKNEILGGLSEDQISFIARESERVTLKAGQFLFHHGDHGDTMYLLIEGTLEVSVFSQEGKKLSLNILKPGELLGEISAMDGRERTATVSAKKASILLRITRQTIRQMLADNAEFAINLIEVLCSRLRWINQQVEDQFMLTTESRLASRLLLLCDKFADDELVLKMSQSELSEFLGTSRETVNKTLQNWRGRRIIKLGRGSVKVLKPDILRNMISI